MADDVIVRASNVSKKFCRSLKHVMAYGTRDIARNLMGLSSRPEILRDGEFWAVDNLSFELRQNESLGIIGSNGSGKSTLLKMLNGIFMPDKGKIEIKGKVGALIEVGAGFHPMLTGRENIYINGAILGISRREIAEKFDEIVEFADIGDFIDSPVKHYSSGMYVRLGFAVAINMRPDILLIDEVLSVGDLSFQNKSLKRLAELRQKARAIIFVSHNLEHIKTLCSKVLLLNKGVPIFYGGTDEALLKYHEISRELTLQSEERKKAGFKDVGHISTGDIDLMEGGLLDANGQKTQRIQQSEDINIYYDFHSKIRIEKPYFSIGILNEKSELCIWQISREYCDLSEIIPGDYRLNVSFKEPRLVPGVYNFSFALRSAATGETYERYAKNELCFIINGENIPRGMIACKSEWELTARWNTD